MRDGWSGWSDWSDLRLVCVRVGAITMVLPWRDADADADGDYCMMTLLSNCVVPCMHGMVWCYGIA